MKIRRQTGQNWSFLETYKGFPITLMRTWGLMTTYFVLVDYGRRNHKEMFSRPLVGPFLIAGCAATFAWWVVWPLELIKSQVREASIFFPTRLLQYGLCLTCLWSMMLQKNLIKSIVNPGELLVENKTGTSTTSPGLRLKKSNVPLLGSF